VTCLGVLRGGEPALLDAAAEAVVGQRGRHDVEGGPAGRGQQREDMHDFDEGAGPCNK